MNPVPDFPPIREAALARLADFLPLAGRYATERNFVRPGNDHVSKLSPWLQKRLLLEEEVVAAAHGRWSFEAVEKFVQEVYWRTYWKGWLEQRPAAWTRWRTDTMRWRETLSGARRDAWQAACAGRTGIACFDEWVRELVATGYLHNHARMWFASIWIFTLRLPWELGAAFFYEHLLDGDAASNTLSWRWVAGLQTPGKTYLARADNIAHYTEGRQAPAAGQLAVEPLAIVEEPLPKVALWRPAADSTLPTGGRVGLWLHPEDLAIECGELASLPVAAVFAPWPANLPKHAGWASRVGDWTKQALGDGARRAAAHYQAELVAGDVDDLAVSLIAWARERKITSVVAYRPFVGPWWEEAARLEAALASAGLALHWHRRAWDATHFPHATKGYFPFWERIRSVR